MNIFIPLIVYTTLICSKPVIGAPSPHPEGVMLCHGIADIVGRIKQQRQTGKSESDNDGLEILRQLEREVKQDLITPVDAFLANTERLPARWSAALFTHACLYNYTGNLAQVALMSTLISQQCDLKHTGIACIDKIFTTLPQQTAI